ncbi:unnamed protein product [Pleuronectes platessa]|uniref:Uncharacterized protein n=1 Tax=Pleuronectes platessa TaxID=8262 RepID=A0A9N7V4L0_PLEPL|nr:unnamed protein product [Pleuronectes platessa]
MYSIQGFSYLFGNGHYKPKNPYACRRECLAAIEPHFNPLISPPALVTEIGTVAPAYTLFHGSLIMLSISSHTGAACGISSKVSQLNSRLCRDVIRRQNPPGAAPQTVNNGTTATALTADRGDFAGARARIVTPSWKPPHPHKTPSVEQPGRVDNSLSMGHLQEVSPDDIIGRRF